MQTSTQLTINQKAISMCKYSWAKELFLELDNGDSEVGGSGLPVAAWR